MQEVTDNQIKEQIATTFAEHPELKMCKSCYHREHDKKFCPLLGKPAPDYILDVSVGLAYVQIEKLADSRIHSRCTCHGVRFVHELQNLFWNIIKQQLKIEL